MCMPLLLHPSEVHQKFGIKTDLYPPNETASFIKPQLPAPYNLPPASQMTHSPVELLQHAVRTAVHLISRHHLAPFSDDQ